MRLWSAGKNNGIAGHAEPRNDCNRRCRPRSAGAPRWSSGRARLIPMIKAAAGRIERDREIPSEVLDAMHEARLFRMLIPRSIGGEEVEPSTYLPCDGGHRHGRRQRGLVPGAEHRRVMSAAYLAPEVAKELFGDPRAAVATGAPAALPRPSSPTAAIA